MSHGAHMTHCFQGEYEHTCKYGDDDCPARVLEKKMKTVEVSQSALESLQKMVEQLQGERDELLKILQAVCKEFDVLKFPLNSFDMSQAAFVASMASNVIAKCTAKPEVLE